MDGCSNGSLLEMERKAWFRSKVLNFCSFPRLGGFLEVLDRYVLMVHMSKVESWNVKLRTNLPTTFPSIDTTLSAVRHHEFKVRELKSA